jgi:TonB family protein
MVRFILATTIFILPALLQTGAPQQRTAAGPVVNAYLTGLAEELNELDFQLRHREISRSDYDRAYQRLTILRRFVERRAIESQQDRVPEFEVLTVDEFDMLGLGAKPEAETLRIGAVLDQRWKLIGIERGTPRFFVFEKLTAPSALDGLASRLDRKPRPTPNPRDAIETVIVYEEPPKKAANPPPQPAPTRVPDIASLPRSEVPPPQPPKPELLGLRIVSFYLPVYTAEARKRSIEGEVVINALFQRDRKIKDVVVERGLGYGLDERAIDAVKRTHFEPARRDGQPIDLRAQIIFTFKQGRVTVQTRAVKK